MNFIQREQAKPGTVEHFIDWMGRQEMYAPVKAAVIESAEIYLELHRGKGR